MAELHQIFVHAAYGPGLVLLWRRCDMLCISGFINDAMFSYNGSVAHYRVGQKTGPRTHNYHSFLTDLKKIYWKIP